jgi:hypothetical protein
MIINHMHVHMYNDDIWEPGSKWLVQASMYIIHQDVAYTSAGVIFKALQGQPM